MVVRVYRTGSTRTTQKINLDDLSITTMSSSLVKHPVLRTHPAVLRFLATIPHPKDQHDINQHVKMLEARVANSKPIRDFFSKMLIELEMIVKSQNQLIENDKNQS